MFNIHVLVVDHNKNFTLYHCDIGILFLESSNPYACMAMQQFSMAPKICMIMLFPITMETLSLILSCFSGEFLNNCVLGVISELLINFSLVYDVKQD